METKDIILELRKKRGLSQDELANKVMVTRQAVFRWENGVTIPNRKEKEAKICASNVEVTYRWPLFLRLFKLIHHLPYR